MAASHLVKYSCDCVMWACLFVRFGYTVMQQDLGLVVVSKMIWPSFWCRRLGRWIWRWLVDWWLHWIFKETQSSQWPLNCVLSGPQKSGISGWSYCSPTNRCESQWVAFGCIWDIWDMFANLWKHAGRIKPKKKRRPSSKSVNDWILLTKDDHTHCTSVCFHAHRNLWKPKTWGLESWAVHLAGWHGSCSWCEVRLSSCCPDSKKFKQTGTWKQLFWCRLELRSKSLHCWYFWVTFGLHTFESRYPVAASAFHDVVHMVVQFYSHAIRCLNEYALHWEYLKSSDVWVKCVESEILRMWTWKPLLSV